MEKITYFIASKKFFEFPDHAPPQPFLFNEIFTQMMCHEDPPPENLIQETDLRSRSKYKPMLGFQDCEKVDGIPNIELPLVITFIVVNQTVAGLLVDESSCNILYTDTLE